MTRVAIASTVFAVMGLASLQAQGILRTIDGTGNNVLNPTIGSAGSMFLRLAPADYADGVSAPNGVALASPRAISNAVCAQTTLIPNTAPVSDILWQWGQFIDHDLDLADTASPSTPFHVLVPTGDPFFDPMSTGTAVISLFRSAFHPTESPRQQLNSLTSFIDGSMVYGSDPLRAAFLRDFSSAGKLSVSPGNLLPFNTFGLPNASSTSSSFFVAGDVRANEQVGLTAMHTLFVREHNLIVDALNFLYPGLNSNDLYQVARALVAAEIQVITYEEFLPALLGPNALPLYMGYDPFVDTSVSNEFATAAFRVGHTLLSPTLLRLGSDLNPIPQGNLPLRDAFFSPSRVQNEGGIDPILRGLSAQRAQQIDCMIIDDVRNFLFGPPGAGGFDLATLNIQRGREHGLARYNATRIALGFAPKATFADVTSDVVLQANLASVYASPNDIDLWVGGLAEDHVPGALVGETFFTIIADQFRRARDGDRFWYQYYLPEPFLSLVSATRLSDIVRRNTGIGAEISNDMFHVPTAP